MSHIRKPLGSSFLISIRESFIALLPFILAKSFILLILALVVAAPLEHPPIIHATQWLTVFSAQLSLLFPLLALISLSFHFAKHLQLSAVVVCSLAFSSLLALHIPAQSEGPNIAFITDVLGDPRAVILPILAAYLLRPLIAIKAWQLIKGKLLSSYLKQHLNNSIPTLICFILLFIVGLLLSVIAHWIVDPLIVVFNAADMSVQLFIRTLLTHVFWVIGVHGDNAYLLLTGTQGDARLLAPNLTTDQFINLFIIFGGSGATLSLVIAIYIGTQDATSRRLAKIAAPFALFNINEMLIYGLPIVFNPRLLVPFITVPLLNLCIAYTAISTGYFSFNGHSFPWITPPLLNAYIASGSITTVLLQVGLITLGTCIYLPFVKRLSIIYERHDLDNGLAKRVQLNDEIGRSIEQQYTQKQSESLRAEIDLEKTIKDVLAGDLQLHYQPKLSLETNQVVGFEALLRITDETGVLKGPYFVGAFQRAGYSHIIDQFVIDTVAEDIANWELEGFTPKVSINLDPNSMADPQMLSTLIDRLGSYGPRIEIEILESAFMLELNRVESCMGKLKDLGFSFLLDDFGTGYSSLSLLSRINVDSIKLDRSILENANEHKGRILYRQTCYLCRSLGFSLIAEGVETPEQAEFVKASGVQYVQGWLYAKALPGPEAKAFALNRAANP
ncbi:EAL domain-containing protein [Pseudomonas sp. M30-35]|uniref:EAL domain-containing protein n=1 Tax=Pseudomonas sp. M30-35 TaxID=1981174 RepID=UPI000B3C98D4|nr:EAL domain-containing protein [Pseudomonas sp. M30-35]ARU90355.1 diguanylate phosphodiesterase [Pseudomonas sp. M30-35]